MARSEKQKLKLLYLVKIFEEHTDETHGITTQQIISLLDGYDIRAERKSIYSDIEFLREFGLDIEARKDGREFAYYLMSRDFELPEIKLLVDSVQASRFITAEKSKKLIKKIENLCSGFEAKQLQRQVFVQDRVKSMNESIFYNVDSIHSAINSNKKITFLYWNWNADKKQQLRRDGARYKVSPWGLSWDNENYYLVAFDDEEKKIKHYRVDKMVKIDLTEEDREGRNIFKGINMAGYSGRTFGMFGGEERTVSILCENKMAGVMIDRFGKKVQIIREDEEHFSVHPRVAVSRQFFGWIMGLGPGVKLTGPDDVTEEMKREVKELYDRYGK